jgi:polyphosphate kinase
MERNLFRRVEIAVPLLDKKLRERVIEQLEAYVADTAQSWLLQPDGVYLRAVGEAGAKPVQQKTLEETLG